MTTTLISILNTSTKIVASNDGNGNPVVDLFSALITAAGISLVADLDFSGGAEVDSDIFEDSNAQYLSVDGIQEGMYLELLDTTVANVELDGIEVVLPYLVLITEVISDTKVRIDQKFTNIINILNNTGDFYYRIRSNRSIVEKQEGKDYILAILEKAADWINFEETKFSFNNVSPIEIKYDETGINLDGVAIDATHIYKFGTDDVNPFGDPEDIFLSFNSISGNVEMILHCSGDFMFDVDVPGNYLALVIFSRLRQD